jgi:transposase InsO family protein
LRRWRAAWTSGLTRRTDDDTTSRTFDLPVENGFIESFNGRLRDECVNMEVFLTLDGVREKLTRWQEDDNHRRPHSSLQDETPAAFAARWVMATESLLISPE